MPSANGEISVDAGVSNHVAIAIFGQRGDTKMKAYRIDRFGGVDGIVLQSSDDRRLGLGEVLIRVRTSTAPNCCDDRADATFLAPKISRPSSIT
jgi:hypothetical protein